MVAGYLEPMLNLKTSRMSSQCPFGLSDSSIFRAGYHGIFVPYVMFEYCVVS